MGFCEFYHSGLVEGTTETGVDTLKILPLSLREKLKGQLGKKKRKLIDSTRLFSCEVWSLFDVCEYGVRLLTMDVIRLQEIRISYLN